MCTHDLHDAHPSHESFSYIFKFPLENHSKMCWKAMPKILPIFLAAQTRFWWHFGTQNRSKIISKSTKIVLAPKKRHRAPSKASKKPPEACYRMPPKAPQNGSKKPQEGESCTPIHISLQFAMNSNIPYAKIALPVYCPSFMICTRMLTLNSSVFAVQR